MDHILILKQVNLKKKMYVQFYCHVWVYFFLGPSAWRDSLIHWFGASVIICHLFLKVLIKSKKGDQWCVPLSLEVVISEFLAGFVTRNAPLKSEFHTGKLGELPLVQVYNSVWLPPFTQYEMKAVRDTVYYPLTK